jgi:hypothetical protein
LPRAFRSRVAADIGVTWHTVIDTVLDAGCALLMT